jgi:hypothetical protein
MLRNPQHERKIIDDFKSSPFVLSSYVEGLREGFSAAASYLMNRPTSELERRSRLGEKC